MSDWKKYLHIGLGGRHCSCCFPAPGSLDRRKQYRKAKRKAEAEAIRIGIEELYDAEAELMAYAEEMDDADAEEMAEMQEDFAESTLSEPVEYTEDYFRHDDIFPNDEAYYYGYDDYYRDFPSDYSNDYFETNATPTVYVVTYAKYIIAVFNNRTAAKELADNICGSYEQHIVYTTRL